MTTPSLPYRTIPLSKGQVALVDPEDYDRLAARKWFAYFCQHTKTFYARAHAFPFKQGDYTLHMHREVLGLLRGDPRIGDHINHDTLDNRRSNLRIATRSQNARNTRMRAHNTSGFTGVGWHAKTGKWAAYISIRRKKHHLGLFATKEDAYAAYCSAATRHHGEFSPVQLSVAPPAIGNRLNRPNGTGLRGVQQLHNRFRARISKAGKRIVLGYFDTAQLAHEAYLAAAVIEVDDGRGEEYREYDGEEPEF